MARWFGLGRQREDDGADHGDTNGDARTGKPEANVIDNRYFVYDLLNRSGSPMWDGTRVLLPPSFAFGSRISNSSPNYAPPNIGFPSQNIASSTDIAASLTKYSLRARHDERVPTGVIEPPSR